MKFRRIIEIHKETAYPESLSVYQALLQVWNECQQESNKLITELETKLDAICLGTMPTKHNDQFFELAQLVKGIIEKHKH